MDAHLSSLPGTACEHGPEDGNIQPPLHWSESHVHVGCGLFRFDSTCIPARWLVLAGTSAGCLLATIELGHVLRVHVGDGKQPPAEHALPITLLYVLAMVGSQKTLGSPFLLEEGVVVRLTGG